LIHLLLVYVCVVVVACVMRYGRILRNAMTRDPVVAPTTFAHRVDPAPMVSVLVPARDEEHNIRGCLDSLVAQDYPNFEIIVTDDRSEDRTAEIVQGYVKRDRRVKLIRNRELPEGWGGRHHALHLAAQQARGEFLLFTDADTVHAPQSLSQSVTCAVTNGIDLLSLVLRLKDETFWQKFLNPLASVTLMVQYRMKEVNDPTSDKFFANGQYSLIRREAYDQVGGREAIRSEFMDLALGRRVKQAGLKTWMAHAGDRLAQARSWNSFRGIWNGWTRIFLGVLQRSPRLAVQVLLRFVFLILGPFALFLGVSAALLLGHGGPLLWTLFGLTGLVVVGVQTMGIAGYHLCHADLRYAALFYPAAFFITGMVLHAIVKLCVGGEVVWKGQRYQASRRDTAGGGEKT